MSKRLTVRKYLKKRLAESKEGIQSSLRYEDLASVLGGPVDKEDQYRQNMLTDILQLEYLLEKLDEFDHKKQEIMGVLKYGSLEMRYPIIERLQGNHASEVVVDDLVVKPEDLLTIKDKIQLITQKHH